MKKIATALLSVFLLILIMIAFAPKRYLYNAVQHLIVNENIIVSGERVNDRAFGLDINDAHLYVKDIFIGQLKEMTLTPFVLVNTFTCKEFEASKELRSLIPLSIEKASVMHWIGQPYTLFLKANGSFGEAKGFVHLKERKVYLEVFSTPEFEKYFKPLAKKSEEGFYVYEQRY